MSITSLPVVFRALPRAIAIIAGLGIGVTGCASTLAAQNVDSLAGVLSSSVIQDRADAASALQDVSPTLWSGAARRSLFGALVEEGRRAPATPTQSDRESSELRGEYQIDLVRLAVTLHDPESLEGMVWLGLQISGKAEDFVVAQGATAIPFLEEAWGAAAFRRPTILSVVTRIQDGGSLSSEESARVLKIQLEADGSTWAITPEVQAHPEFTALVQAVADTGSIAFSRQTAAAVVPSLQAAVAAAGPVTLWAREGAILSVFCQGRSEGHCTAAQNLWSTVSGHLAASRWRPALNTIDAFNHELASICGQWTPPMGCPALVGNAVQVRALASARLGQGRR